MYARGNVCAVKMNPVNHYLGRPVAPHS
jgi:hypothetical protein